MRTRTRTPIELRFWAKVDKTEDGCWRWNGSLNREGYGSLSRGGKYGGSVLAHRVSYEINVGPIPAGMELDHVRARGCTHRDCVNPDHLEPVDHAENMARSTGHNSLKTCCIHGHPFDEANTIVYRDGRRKCRTCHSETLRRYNAKRRDRVAELEADR